MADKKLEQKCIKLFGKVKGKKLFQVMEEIGRKDFCVATDWTGNEVSISIFCSRRRTLCKENFA